MIVSSAGLNAAPMYREPFDGIQLRKLPEPPPLLSAATAAELPGITLHLPPSLCPSPRRTFWNSAIRPSVCPMAQLPRLWTRWLPAA